MSDPASQFRTTYPDIYLSGNYQQALHFQVFQHTPLRIKAISLTVSASQFLYLLCLKTCITSGPPDFAASAPPRFLPSGECDG
jgi:hypothetical protein